MAIEWKQEKSHDKVKVIPSVWIDDGGNMVLSAEAAGRRFDILRIDGDGVIYRSDIPLYLNLVKDPFGRFRTIEEIKEQEEVAEFYNRAGRA